MASNRATGLFCLLALVACDEPGTSEETLQPDAAQTPVEPEAPKEPEAPAWSCVVSSEAVPEFTQTLGCEDDFAALASEPVSAAIPGARSVKTVLDRNDAEQYFQNSNVYKIHWAFASAHLSAPERPPVPALAQFNQTEYFSPTRRFILGALTRYEHAGVWVWELSPYDTADATMIADGYRKVRDSIAFGDELLFHPTSAPLATVAESLPEDVRVISTAEIYEGIDYQPLNLARSVGRLRFITEAEATRVDFRDIAVLEAVPNDIGVVQGIVTQTFQTPLSHINVLSQNRGTPNMGLRGAWSNEALRALEGQWVELSVGSSDWSVREVSQAEADEWWVANRPEAIEIGMMDTEIQSLTDIADILDLENLPLGEALTKGVPAFGGKATHFSALAHIDEVPNPRAFAVPVYFFDQFMTQNELWPVLETLLADGETRADGSARAEALEDLRDRIKEGVVDPDFEAALMAKLAAEYPNTRMRFRSSTNAEDVSNFNGAGLYTSKSGEPGNPGKPVMDAVRKVWASVYSDRAFSEREYYGIEHRHIGMALLVHRSFPDEDANGVAITANVFDPQQLDAPSFYVNVQEGEASVVLPDAGVTTDQFLYYYQSPNLPTVYLFHSNQIPSDETVLSRAEVQTLGEGLRAVHEFFRPVYGAEGGFYGMDVEFKFNSTGGEGSQLFIKQARPYPGWGSNP